jgi:hypothetical protein
MLHKQPGLRPDQIVACVGRGDGSEARDAGCAVHMPAAEKIALWESSPPADSIIGNIVEALGLAVEDGTDWCVMTEDDLELSHDWLTRALALADVARASRGRCLVQACSSHTGLHPDREGVGSDKVKRWSRTYEFWGNQLLVFERGCAREIQEWIPRLREWAADPKHSKHVEGKGVVQLYWGPDRVIAAWCHLAGVPIWATCPSLARHVGLVGTSDCAVRWPTLRWEG